jgi:hypothetical protein
MEKSLARAKASRRKHRKSKFGCELTFAYDDDDDDKDTVFIIGCYKNRKN